MLSARVFIGVAREVVPKLRDVADELGCSEIAAKVESSMTATIEIEGRESRVRVTVALVEPDDDDDGDED